MNGARTKDYNQRQRIQISGLRARISQFMNPDIWYVVDTKRSAHLAEQFEIGNLQRFEIRSSDQVNTYKLYVVHK